jgi:hypothetical protein
MSETAIIATRPSRIDALKHAADLAQAGDLQAADDALRAL